jgi:hypothetical protein
VLLGEGRAAARHLASAARDLAVVRDPTASVVAREAASMAARSGWRAWSTSDPFGALDLFTRAAELLEPTELAGAVDEARAAVATAELACAPDLRPIGAASDRTVDVAPAVATWDAARRGASDLTALARSLVADPAVPRHAADAARRLLDVLASSSSGGQELE